jgi:hypothetical protein
MRGGYIRQVVGDAVIEINASYVKLARVAAAHSKPCLNYKLAIIWEIVADCLQTLIKSSAMLIFSIFGVIISNSPY